jgi:hypothetical protein
MTYITSSPHPHITYTAALEAAGKRQVVKVWEVQYPYWGSPIYYEAHTVGTLQQGGMLPDTINIFCEMTISAFDMFGSLTPRTKRIINKVMRRIDDSQAWPIHGRFNATERAIRRLQGGDFDAPFSYWKSLEAEISTIVNQES